MNILKAAANALRRPQPITINVNGAFPGTKDQVAIAVARAIDEATRKGTYRPREH